MSQTDVASQKTTATFLSKADIPLAAHFIEATRQGMSAPTRHHLKPKSAADLTDVFQRGGCLIGIKDELGQLQAFAMLNPANDGLCKIESVCIASHHQGNGLGKKLIALALDWADASWHSKLQAKVAQDNHRSLALFQHARFQISHAGHDQAGNYDFYLLDKKLVF